MQRKRTTTQNKGDSYCAVFARIASHLEIAVRDRRALRVQVRDRRAHAAKAQQELVHAHFVLTLNDLHQTALFAELEEHEKLKVAIGLCDLFAVDAAHEVRVWWQ